MLKIRRSILALLLILGMALSTSATEKPTPAASVPTPSEFLHFEVGADRKLADYRQIASYFKALAAASDRVQIETLGKTTLGEDMIMAVISSPENLRNKARYQEIAHKLADPRGLTAQQIDALAAEGKTILLITCNIHSTEIGSSQMAMEWAYKLATAQDPETLKRLNDSIVLLVPSLNPDGQIMVTDWYRKYLGTKYEGGPMPYLYHHYVGHDNNRDWFMLTQIETRNVSRMVYHQWFPQFWLDEHQMGYYGPRIYIPPNADPVASWSIRWCTAATTSWARPWAGVSKKPANPASSLATRSMRIGLGALATPAGGKTCSVFSPKWLPRISPRQSMFRPPNCKAGKKA